MNGTFGSKRSLQNRTVARSLAAAILLGVALVGPVQAQRVDHRGGCEYDDEGAIRSEGIHGDRCSPATLPSRLSPDAQEPTAGQERLSVDLDGALPYRQRLGVLRPHSHRSAGEGAPAHRAAGRDDEF